MRDYGFFIFFLTFFIFYCIGGLYAAWRINSGLKISLPYRNCLYISFTIMAALSTIGYIFSTFNTGFFISFISPAGAIWQGVVGISFTVLFLNDLINFTNHAFKIKNFRYYSTIISLFTILFFIIYSLANPAFILKRKDINLKVKGLQPEKLTAVLWADIHITPLTKYSTIQNLVEKTNELNPDIIFIAGDLIDIDISDTYTLYGLDKLKATYGIFAVTGNHEYYTGIKYFEKLCENMDIKLLRNENFIIEDIIAIAGINDKMGQKRAIDTVDIPAAFKGLDENLPVLFISHRPEPFDKALQQGFNIVQFSGHTHAGQMLPLDLVRRFFKYNYGLYEKDGSYMYITSGVRWWGPPMRTFTKSELVKFTLEKQY